MTGATERVAPVPVRSRVRSRRPAARFGAVVVGALVALAAAVPAAVGAGPTEGGAGGRPGVAHPVPVRVASYNVHFGQGEDLGYDPARQAAAIRDLRADVVGLQEVDVHWDARSQWQDVAAELGRRTGMHTAFAPIYDLEPPAPGQPRRQFGVGLLSRWPVVSVENHPITRLSTQDPDPVPAPAPGFLEAVVSVRGTPVHVYVTHLDYRPDPSVRALQVQDTLAVLADDPPGTPQVLVGDLNADPSAPELAPLWRSNGGPLDDAWSTARWTRGQALTYPAALPQKRIDVVAPSAGTIVLTAEVPSRGAALTASDHRPLVTTLLLTARRDHR